MPTFHYQAFDADRKLIVGDRQADTLQQAIAQLESEGLDLVSIGLASELPSVRSQEKAGSGKAIPATETGLEREMLRSHLARVLEQGRAIAPALRAYAEEMPSGGRQRQLLAVVNVLERGDADEATKALTALPEYWIPLLSAASSSRDPARVLHEFLRESRQADDLRRQRRRMIAYPLLIFTLAAVVLVALCYFVIPIFRDIFYSFDMTLPTATKLLLNVSHWITSGSALIDLAILVGFVALLWFAKRLFPSVGNWIAERVNLPFGRATAYARLAHFTADLLESGLSVPAALRVAAVTLQRPHLRRAVWQFAGRMEQNDGVVSSGRRTPLTTTIRHALLAEVPSNTRIRLLREIGQAYADRARMRLSWTRGMVEPIAIGVVGLLVGIIVIALFLPLMNLITALT